MGDLFISYASEDRAQAARVAAALTQLGWQVWWDRQIAPGRSFDQVIEQAIDQARCVIVLWSRHAVGSDWVKSEAAEGLRRQLLLPALLEAVKLPLEFRRIQAADLTAWNGDPADPEFTKLAQAVARLVPPGSAAAASAPAAPGSTVAALAGLPAHAPAPAARRRWLLAGLAALVVAGVAAWRWPRDPPRPVGPAAPTVPTAASTPASNPSGAVSRAPSSTAASRIAALRRESERWLALALQWQAESLAAEEATMADYSRARDHATRLERFDKLRAAMVRLSGAATHTRNAAQRAGQAATAIRDSLAGWPTDASADAETLARRLTSQARQASGQAKEALDLAVVQRGVAGDAAAEVLAISVEQSRLPRCSDAATARQLDGDARKAYIANCVRGRSPARSPT